MAKPKSPLLSLGARGTIGDALTFQQRLGGSIVRKKPTPTDPKSDPQLWHRYLYKQACQYWNTLSPAQKQTWRIAASRYRITGFNYFIRNELKRLEDLVLCLPLDENTGIIASDYSGRRNHATITGASWATGIIRHCLSFDGVNDRADCGTNVTLATPYALELWFKPERLGVDECLAHLHLNTDRQMIDFHVTNKILAMLSPTRGRWGAKVWGAGDLDKWWHLFINIPSSNMNDLKIYVNGVDDTGALVANVGAYIEPDGHCRFGQLLDGTRSFKGAEDEPRLYDALLPPADILIHSERRWS